MTIINPVSRRWFLGGLIAAPAIVVASNIMPVSAMEWMGAPQWEGIAGDFAWRARPDQLVDAGRKDVPYVHSDGHLRWRYEDAGMQPSLELKHRSEIDHGEWARLTRMEAEYPAERRPPKQPRVVDRAEIERFEQERKRVVLVTEDDAPRDLVPRQFELRRYGNLRSR